MWSFPVLLLFVLFPTASTARPTGKYRDGRNLRGRQSGVATSSTEQVKDDVLDLDKEISEIVSTKDRWSKQYFQRALEPKSTYKNKHIVIVGAGVAGLYFAIRVRMDLGAKVEIFEKRGKFSRKNLLELYPSTIHELKLIGAFVILGTTPYNQYNVKSMEEKPNLQPIIPIGVLQHTLLRIALLLGVVVHPYSPRAETDDFSTYDAVYDGTGKEQAFQHFKIEKGPKSLGPYIGMTFFAAYSKQQITQIKPVTYKMDIGDPIFGVTGYIYQSLSGDYSYFVGQVWTEARVEIKKLDDIGKESRSSLATGILETAKITSTGPSAAVSVFKYGGSKDPVQPVVVRDGRLYGLLGDALTTPDWAKATGANHAFFSGRLHVRLLRLYFTAPNGPASRKKQMDKLQSIGNEVLPKIRLSTASAYVKESVLTGFPILGGWGQGISQTQVCRAFAYPKNKDSTQQTCICCSLPFLHATQQQKRHKK